MPDIENLNAEEDSMIADLRAAGLYWDARLTEMEIPDKIRYLVSKEIVARFRVIPVAQSATGVVTLVTDDASTLKRTAEIAALIKKPVIVMVTEKENEQLALSKFYDVTGTLQIIEVTASDEHAETTDITPLKQKVNDLLDACIDSGASDLHLLPYSGGVYITMRINGFIEDFTERWNFLAGDGNVVVNIIKQYDKSSNADVTNTKMPQSGHFTLTRRGVKVECRLETVPVGNALSARQKVNIRFQRQKKSMATLANIYSGKDLQDIENTLYRGGSGLFLFSGPVGTGKTTSLYAAIDYLWSLAEAKNHKLVVYCIENPIEQVNEKYTQVEVRLAERAAISLTEKVALRSALRSDPDIILYGEIRDSSDADVAMRASQTGLKMFATIHAGDVLRTINRLMDLDVPRMSLLAEMRLIVCQRLIGVLCPRCSRPHVLTEQEKAILSPEELHFLEADGAHLMERGSLEDRRKCTCQDGLIKRVALPEYVVFDDRLRGALLNMKDFQEVPRLLEENGFQSMWMKGLMKVRRGEAELDDVIQKIGKG